MKNNIVRADKLKKIEAERGLTPPIVQVPKYVDYENNGSETATLPISEKRSTTKSSILFTMEDKKNLEKNSDSPQN